METTKHHAEFTAPFADGDYVFRLGYAGIKEMETHFGTGIYHLLRNFETGFWRGAHIREGIRLALIGGGLKPVEALALVQNYVEARPLSENAELTLRILSGAIFGEDGWKRNDTSPAWSAAKQAEMEADFAAANPDVARAMAEMAASAGIGG